MLTDCAAGAAWAVVAHELHAGATYAVHELHAGAEYVMHDEQVLHVLQLMPQELHPQLLHPQVLHPQLLHPQPPRQPQQRLKSQPAWASLAVAITITAANKAAPNANVRIRFITSSFEKMVS